jgi:hypothetical protein
VTPPDAIQALAASISAVSDRSAVQGVLIFASAARACSMIGLEASGRRQSSARVAVNSSMARTWRVLRTTCFQLHGRRHAHADEILFIAAGGDGAGGCWMREHAIFRHQRGGGDLHHHESRFEAGVAGEERRQLFVERGIHQAIDAALGDPGQRGERDGHGNRAGAPAVRHGSCRREMISSSITSGLSVTEFNSISKTRRALGECVANGAVHLRRAAQRVGILHAPAADVRLADLAAFEQRLRFAALWSWPGMRAGLMNARIESARSAAQAIDGHGADQVGRFGKRFGIEKFQAADRRAWPGFR